MQVFIMNWSNFDLLFCARNKSLKFNLKLHMDRLKYNLSLIYYNFMNLTDVGDEEICQSDENLKNPSRRGCVN